MAHEIRIPELAGSDAVTLVKWQVREGDEVLAGDVVAEFETDKATMEIEAPVAGRIARLLVPAGTRDLAAEAIIGTISTDKAESASAQHEPAESEPPSSAPLAPREDSRHSGRIIASPLAKRLASGFSIDLSTIEGTGPQGRIVKVDVIRAHEATPPAREPDRSPATAVQSDVEQLFAPGSYEKIPLDSMRRTVARRLVDSVRTVPHFRLTMDCRIGALLDLRSQLNALAPRPSGADVPGYKLSVNDMIIKAMGMALKAVPDANVTWTKDGILKHRKVDVAIAVSIPGGLITPIVRDVDTKTVTAISNEARGLIERARQRKLSPAEFQGGTTAVSNLGMFGIRQFDAIINPPHATILAIGAGEKRPVVVDGELTVQDMMSATLSADHRAIDGALAAELLAAFRAYVEAPLTMLA